MTLYNLFLKMNLKKKMVVMTLKRENTFNQVKSQKDQIVPDVT